MKRTFSLPKIIFYFLFAFIGIASIACKKNAEKNKILSIEDILVKNNEITGWAYSGAGWVANNGSELTTQIDGGSETYIKYGFVEGAHQKYIGSIDGVSCDIDLFVYDMASLTNTTTIFDDPDLLSSALIWSDNPAGISAKYVRGNGLSQTMYFYRDKYLVELSVTADNEESLNILKQFAKNVDEKVKQAL